MSYVPNWPPKETIDPDTISRYGLLAKVPTDELHVLLETPLPEDARPGLRKLKAMCLIELLYRAGIRTREAYQLAWQAFFDNPVFVPDSLLEAPSKMNPHERGWARTRRVIDTCRASAKP